MSAERRKDYKRRPGILLDRDGTVNVDYHYVGIVERVQLIPGVAEAIRRFNQADIPVAIVTNQSGVARGFYTEEDANKVNEYIAAELARHDAHIDLYLISPYHPDGFVDKYAWESDKHKPYPGMGHIAAHILGLDLERSIVVGDRETDMQFARNLGTHGVYLGKEPLPMHHYGPAGNPHVKPFPSLAAAVGYIIERLTGMSQSEFPIMNYTDAGAYFLHYSDEIRETLARVRRDSIDAAAAILYRACDDGSEVFLAGNGGAAAIANHFETDLIKRLTKDHGWYTDIHSLCTNQSLLTATANDIGYDAVFSYQLEKHAVQHDVLVAFSVSGNSANILRALQCARELGMESIAIVGGEGDKAAAMADIPIVIPATNYGVVEDIMQMIAHALAQYLQQKHMSSQAIQSARF